MSIATRTLLLVAPASRMLAPAAARRVGAHAQGGGRSRQAGRRQERKRPLAAWAPWPLSRADLGQRAALQDCGPGPHRPQARGAARPPRPVRQARRSRTPAQARDRPGGSHGAGADRLDGAVARRDAAGADGSVERGVSTSRRTARTRTRERGAAVALDQQGDERSGARGSGAGASQGPTRIAGAGPMRRHVGPAVYGSPKGTAAAPITVEAYPGERPVIAAMVSSVGPVVPPQRVHRRRRAGAAGAQGVSLGNTSGVVPSHVEISYNEIRNFGSPQSRAGHPALLRAATPR